MIDTESMVQLKNTLDATKETWLKLPFDDDEFSKALLEISATEGKMQTFDEVVAGVEPTQRTWYVGQYDSAIIKPNDTTDLFEINELVSRAEDLDSYQEDMLYDLIGNGESLETAIELCEDDDTEYYGNTTLVDLARQFYEEGVFSTEFLLKHINYDSIADDLEDDGYEEIGNSVIRRN